MRFGLDSQIRGALPGLTWRRIRRRAERMIAAAALQDPMLGRTPGRRRTSVPDVGLLLTTDAEVHDLNRRFRKKDRPTDVLSFELGDALHPTVLGDVIISVETARRQRGRRTLEEELVFLFQHGLCHLLGYDHRSDAEEATMNARMAALGAEAGRRGRVRPA